MRAQLLVAVTVVIACVAASCKQRDTEVAQRYGIGHAPTDSAIVAMNHDVSIEVIGPVFHHKTWPKAPG